MARRFAEVKNRRSSVQQDNYTNITGVYIDKDDVSLKETNNGFRSVLDKNGEYVYCKFITIEMTVKGNVLKYDVWEDYKKKAIFQVGYGNIIQRFDVLKPIDDDNRLPQNAYDLMNVFGKCDPMNVTAPPEWIDGKRSDTIKPRPSWGHVFDPSFPSGTVVEPVFHCQINTHLDMFFVISHLVLLKDECACRLCACRLCTLCDTNTSHMSTDTIMTGGTFGDVSMPNMSRPIGGRRELGGSTSDQGSVHVFDWFIYWSWSRCI